MLTKEKVMFSTSKKILVVAVAAMSMSAILQASNGKEMYESLGCVGCHGVGGKSTIPIYPSLAGKDGKWIVKQLKDFQSGARKGTTMNAMAPIVVGHEKAISKYLSKQ